MESKIISNDEGINQIAKANGIKLNEERKKGIFELMNEA